MIRSHRTDLTAMCRRTISEATGTAVIPPSILSRATEINPMSGTIRSNHAQKVRTVERWLSQTTENRSTKERTRGRQKLRSENLRTYQRSMEIERKSKRPRPEERPPSPDRGSEMAPTKNSKRSQPRV
ncbi:hypothetical protein U1Q18_001415 [Sarracenia purpurea var. burkii]